MDEFKQQWISRAKEEPVEATLEALTIAALRGTSEDYNVKFKCLTEILPSLKTTNPYILKLIDIYIILNPHKVKDNFKKWWE